MDTISGIPAHPLFVHIPAVLLPLAAIGAVILVIKASWNERYKWAVLVITGLGALGAILAAGAGESLEEALPANERASIHEHAEMGDTAKALALLFFLGVLAWVIVPWFLNRKAAAQTNAAQTNAVGADVPATRTGGPSWLKPVLAVIMLGTAAASVVTVIDAGHSGAKHVWQEEGSGGGDDDGD
jgi:uncharacterized membrane protein